MTLKISIGLAKDIVLNNILTMKYLRFLFLILLISHFYSCHNDVTMYDKNIKIVKRLGNSTMANYVSIYVNGQKVYDEKCNLGWDDYVEKVVIEEDSMFIMFNDTVYQYFPRDTIKVYIGQK